MITKRLANRMKFGSMAAKHGAKGGSVSSEKKKAATAVSLKKARYARMVKMGREGKLKKVEWFPIVDGKPTMCWHIGSLTSCQKFCRENKVHFDFIKDACVMDWEIFSRGQEKR